MIIIFFFLQDVMVFLAVELNLTPSLFLLSLGCTYFA